MGMTNIYMGSLRYGPTGKRRKKHYANPVRKKTPTKFKAYKPSESELQKHRDRQQKQYNSIMEEYMKSKDYPSCDTSKKEVMKYTGTLVKGIATMHKSNAVPVISQQEAEDISKMRRN